ncbi:IS200/IS605 family transposase [Bacteroidota bacterium]
MKPGSFTQIYIQLVFSPFKRECLIKNEYKEELYKYINVVIQKHDHKPIIINGMSDHIHILIGLNPNHSISNIVREIKRSSAIFINKKNWFDTNFKWQAGYGGFSYGQSQLKNIYEYIKKQEIFHQERYFREEYASFLEKFEIPYNKRFLFNFFE